MSDIPLGGRKNAATDSEMGLKCSLVDELTEMDANPGETRGKRRRSRLGEARKE